MSSESNSSNSEEEEEYMKREEDYMNYEDEEEEEVDSSGADDFVVNEDVAEAEDQGDDEVSDGISLSVGISEEDNIYHPKKTARRARNEQELHKDEDDKKQLSEAAKRIRNLRSAIGSSKPYKPKHIEAIKELQTIAENVEVTAEPRPPKMLKYDKEDEEGVTLSAHAVLQLLAPLIDVLRGGLERKDPIPTQEEQNAIRQLNELIKNQE